MRRLVSAAWLLGFCAATQVHGSQARPVERTPSIMVGDSLAGPRRVTRHKTTRPQATRTRRTAVTRARPPVLPRPVPLNEAPSRAINNSIERQLQESQSQQNRQLDINLFRQEIQRNTTLPALGCTPGSLGC